MKSDSNKQPYSARSVSFPRNLVSSVSLNKDSVSNLNNDREVFLWHYRLGHPKFLYLEKLFPELFSNKKPQFFHCEICNLSKQTRSFYPNQNYKESHPFTVIHSDVWGLARVPHITGARWFVTFIDDYTRLTWVYLMKEKNEVSIIFPNFVRMIQNQFETKVKIFRTDNGKEFFNTVLNNFLL